LSTASFYPNKHITTGEGGIVLTDDDRLADRCRDLRNLCFGKTHRFVHEELGWNFRMSNLQAAVGVAQLERLDASLSRKREIGDIYQRELKGTGGLQLPLAAIDGATNLYWVFGVVLKDEVPFDAVGAMAQLQKRGIGTRPFFWPMHLQPVFLKLGLFKDASCPVSERLGSRGFYLPSGLAITNDQIVESASALKEIIR
jgi:perosamine synthetase